MQRSKDDLHVCQASTKNGPCPIQTIELPDGTWTDYCKAHGGPWQASAAEQKRLFGYRLGKWQARVGNFATNPGIKSIRAEIGVLKVLLEERLTSIQDPIQLIAATGPISELIMKINALVVSCEKLEAKQGATLDKNQVVAIAESILGVIFANISHLGLTDSDSEIFMANVSDGIATLLSATPDGTNQNRTGEKVSSISQ